MAKTRQGKLPFLYSVLVVYVVGLLVTIGHVGLLASREREQMSSALMHAHAEIVAERVATVIAESSLSHDDVAAAELFRRLQAERPDLRALQVSWPDGTVSRAGGPAEGIRIRREMSLANGDAPAVIEVSVRPPRSRMFSAVDAWLLLTFLVAAGLGAGVCLYVARRFRQIHQVMDGLEAQRSTVASIQGTDEFAELGRRLVRVFHPWSKPRQRVGTLPRFVAADQAHALAALRRQPSGSATTSRPSATDEASDDDGASGVMSLFDLHVAEPDRQVEGSGRSRRGA